MQDPELQYTLANKIFDEKLSVRETEKLVKEIKNPKKPKEKKPVANSFIYQDLEEKMKGEVLPSIELLDANDKRVKCVLGLMAYHKLIQLKDAYE